MGAIGNTFYSDMLREVACAGLSCRDRKRIMWQITNDRLVHERSQLGCQATPAFDPFVELQRVHHAFKNLCLSSSASGMAAHLKSFGRLGTMLANRVAKLRKLRNLSAHPDVSVYEDVVKFLDSPLLASESSMVDAAVGGVGIAPGLDVSEDADVSDNSGELHGGWNVEELVEMMEFSEAALLQAMAVSDAEHAIAPETAPDQLGVSFVPCADLLEPPYSAHPYDKMLQVELEQQATSVKQGSTVIGANFHVGDHVLITGLVKNDGPDGRTGVLRKFDTEGQRWKVFLPDQCAVFWVKTAHLSLHDTGGQLQGIKRKVNDS